MNSQSYLDPQKIIHSDYNRLSYGQSSLCFFYQLFPESAAYNIGFRIAIHSEINTEVLQKALQSILERHSILRTTFSNHGGELIQIVHEHQKLIFDVYSFADIDEEYLENNIAQDFQSPFDLENEPAMRASLYSIDSQNHVLLITLHHIVSDAWSNKLLLDELQILYFSYLENRLPDLAPLSASYIDYVSWQRNFLSSPDGDKHWQYWQKSLAGELTILALPTDYPRSHSAPHKLVTRRLECSEILFQKLQQLARAEKVSLYMLFMATFQVLLHRYTGQEDIIVGSPMKCRNQKDFLNVVGYFVNTVAIRGQTAENPEFSVFLRQIRKNTLEAIIHQEYPFSLLVERLQPNRDKSHPPIFQTMLVWQKYQQSPAIIDWLSKRGDEDKKDHCQRWDLEASKMSEPESEFDLILEVLETDDNLTLDFRYNALLFEPSTIARMEGHLLTLLQGILANPNQLINQLPILTAPEQTQIINTWNDTATDYSPEKCFQELFDEQVEKNPHAIALRFAECYLTYRELAERANQLAHYLREFGVGAETLVGLCLERSPEMVIGLLGILKAGGVYVPLDPSYPKDRLEYMLVDAKISILITTSHLISRIPTSPTTVICLDQVQEEIAQKPTTIPDAQAKLSNLAYIIYTSGSTGKPKGVQLQHRGLYNLAKAQIQHFNVQPDSRILQFASLCFDASIWEIVMALGSGACLGLAPQESLLPGSPLEQTLTSYQITHVTLPPSALSVMNPENLPALRVIVVAGEACPEEIARQWSSKFRFFNAYGPTESTVCATIAEYNPSLGKPPIGKPIPNFQVYVLDQHLQPLPVGIPGELHIGGIGLARGYLNRPDLTAEKFIPNPFSDDATSRLYKTGDLVRYLPDGNLEFLGRIDTQIKLRGYRIEIGEIEAVLHKQPEVREAVVVLREGTSGDKSLIAYIVSRSPDLTISKLRDFLKTQLPDYMIPSALIFLETMPLNPNGKIDRRALAQMDISRASRSEGEFLPPLTLTEITLAKLWGEVLEVENIGREDNFFELGGHSLLAIKLISRINQELSLNLPLRSLFEAPTIAELAHFITASPASSSEDVLAKDAELEPEIQAHHLPFYFSPQPQQIFLTGATGFVGSYLLYELLIQTPATIYCLMRDADPQSALERLQRKLQQQSLWQETWRERIIPVTGQLSQALFGLEKADFQVLAEKVDVIYHNGALVNFVQPYSSLKATNVLGTQEVLRLASLGKSKPVHFVSTLSVFSPSTYTETILENDLLPSHNGLEGGYAQSKWVAEQLIIQARSRGIPTTIYRPGRITGDSQRGNCNTDDLFSRMIKGCLQLGAMPVDDLKLDMTPVDYVSQAIVYLSRQENSLGQNFHLLNPRSCKLSEFVDWLRNYGYSLEAMPYSQWEKFMIAQVETRPDNALYSLLPMFKEMKVLKEMQLQFDCQNTLDRLANQVVCPAVDATLLETYFAYLIKSGFLPIPNS